MIYHLSYMIDHISSSIILIRQGAYVSPANSQSIDTTHSANLLPIFIFLLDEEKLGIHIVHKKNWSLIKR